MLADVRPDSRIAVTNAKSMFQRTLAAWAMDVLALKKRGWDRPCLRLGTGLASAAPRPRVASTAGRRRAA